MKKTLVLNGGFHNVDEIRFEVSEAAVYDYEVNQALLVDILSDSQFKQADKHFCGIKGCKCNGVMDANVNIED